MASPIQNLIGMSAAGSTPAAYATGAARAAPTALVPNSSVQQIMATQVVQVITHPGKQRITDDKEVVDPSFDAEEKEAKSEGSEDESSESVDNKPKGRLDVMA